jgi:CheY-like chemotaxis protein
MIKPATVPYILMLEDDSEDRYITKSFFSERGYNIGLVLVTYPDEVMEYLHNCIKENNKLPSLILLDKNVPAGDGLEVLKDIKASSFFRGIPVVMISGTDFPEHVAESYKYGASSYILKPSTNELTIKKIETFINYWFETVNLPLEDAHLQVI